MLRVGQVEERGMTMDATVEAAARNLAEALLQAEPVKAYKAADDALKADEAAMAGLERLQELQRALITKQRNGERITREELAQFRKLEREVMSHPKFQDREHAQRQALAFMAEVVGAVSEALGMDFGRLARRGGCC